MIKTRIKITIRSKTFRILTIISLAFFYFIICTSYVQATEREIFPTKDSYVDSSKPEENFGELTHMECGTFYIPLTNNPSTYTLDAYIYFDLSDLVSGWSMVELYLTFSLVSEPVQFVIVRVRNNWDEDSLNWINRPIDDKELVIMDILENNGIIVDVTSYISGEFFSICIRTPYYQDEVVSISSREDILESHRPRLLFSYSPSFNDPTLKIISSFIIIMIIIAVISTVVYLKIKKARNLEDTHHLSRDSFICPNCGEKLTIRIKFCYNCGFKII